MRIMFPNCIEKTDIELPTYPARFIHMEDSKPLCMITFEQKSREFSHPLL